MNKPLAEVLGKEEEIILRRIPLEIALLSLVIAVISLFFYELTIGILILAGGIVAAVNFIW